MTSGYTSLPLENFLSCVLAPVGGGVVHVIGYFLLPSSFRFFMFLKFKPYTTPHVIHVMVRKHTSIFHHISHLLVISMHIFTRLFFLPPAFPTFLLLVPSQLSARSFSKHRPSHKSPVPHSTHHHYLQKVPDTPPPLTLIYSMMMLYVHYRFL